MRRVRWTIPVVAGLFAGAGLLIAAALTLANVSVKAPHLSFWFAKGTFRVDRDRAIAAWRGHPFGVRIDGGSRVEIGCVPITAAGLTLAGVSAFPRRARRVPGLCPNCEYDLNGLAPGAACPECGGTARVGRGGIAAGPTHVRPSAQA